MNQITEKYCKKCKKYYTDTARCPYCYDPRRVVGITYNKSTILLFFRKYLYRNGLKNERSFSDEIILSMLKEKFPFAYNVYTKTTYNTITLRDGKKFGHYRIGALEFKFAIGKTFKLRQVTCTGCNKTQLVTHYRLLWHYLGFWKRRCQVCDSKAIYSRPASDKQRETGLRNFSLRGSNIGNRNNGGAKKKDTSLRAQAKKLNVSVSDLRRGVTEWPAVLPLGTTINGLKIVKAYFDERKNQYMPKYIFFCERCKNHYACSQKDALNMRHVCLPKEN